MTELLVCLKNALFDKKMPLPQNVDWETLQSEASLQAVDALVYSYLKENEKVDSEIFLKWKEKTIRQIVKYTQCYTNHVLVATLFERAGIEYIILKGITSASYYPDPYVRAMGDTDVLVNEKDFDKAVQVLTDNGFLRSDKPENRKYGHHIEFKRGGQSTELHFALPGLPENKMRSKIDALTKDVIKNAVECHTVYGTAKVPDAFYHGLIMLLHMQGHMQKGGMGIRHLADWAVFVSSLGENFENIFKDKLMSVGLWRFACLISQTSEYIGLDYKIWMGQKEPELCELLLQDIISGGNFGVKDRERLRSAKYMPKAETEARGNQLVKYINYGIKITPEIWPFFQKNKWLLPFGFIGYCFRTFFRVLLRKSTVYDLSKHDERYRMFNSLELFKEEK